LISERLVNVQLWRNGAATPRLILTLLIGHLAQIAASAATFMAAEKLETFAVAFYHPR
jgi:hypothetical protein